MLRFSSLRTILSAVIPAVLLGTFVGCSGMEWAPKRGIAFYPHELPAAQRAIDAARAAGKDKECPDEFRAAEKLKNDAYDTYLACHTKEGIAMAVEAANRAAALCPARAARVEPRNEPTPAPTRPPAPAPTASLSASPSTVDSGQCATLTWSSSDASSVSIDSGVGTVAASGSRQVCPEHTTTYTITASGEGGTRTETATVTVRPKVIDRLTLHVHFDFAKANIRRSDDAELQRGVRFLKKYPDAKISVVGFTDNIGSDAYNQRLSERRAQAVKDYLVAHGADAARIEASGRGKNDPVADNKTEKGRAKNRRVEIQVLSE